MAVGASGVAVSLASAPGRTQMSPKMWRSVWGMLVAVGVCVLGGAGASDDVLSYKSLVLGSLSSGERVSGRVRASLFFFAPCSCT